MAIACTAALGADTPSYRVDVIGPNLQGFGMNDLGEVVGRRVISGNQGIAFVAKPNAPVEDLLLPPEWVGSDAYAINKDGVIVGAVSSIGIASVGSRACAWYPNPGQYFFQLLGALPGHTYSTAVGLNDLGDIVGGSGGIGLGMYSNAIHWWNSQINEIPGVSLAADVNNDRVALAGNTLFDLESMRATTVPLPPGTWQGVASNDLNDVGGFCGYIQGFSGCSTFPVIHMPETGWQFVGGCATTTSAVSINDQGDTLTYVQQGGLGVVFFGEPYQSIEPLIAPGQGNWVITGVSVINNRRQILCSGKNLPDNTTQLIRLTPVVFGDLDGDTIVNGSDLGELLGYWGPCPAPCPADFNGDGVVNGNDLGTLLGAWSG